MAGVLDACGHGTDPDTLLTARVMLNSVRKTANRADLSLERILLRLHVDLRGAGTTGSASFIHIDEGRGRLRAGMHRRHGGTRVGCGEFGQFGNARNF